MGKDCYNKYMTTQQDDSQTGDDNAVSNDDLQLKTLQAENESLQQEVEQLSKQLLEKQEQAPEALKELAARAQADLQNAKDRLEREAANSRIFAQERLITELLPCVDNFQRAFAHLPDDIAGHDWVKGVQAVETDLMSRLATAGLAKIDAVGKSVDPQVHEVLQAGPGETDVVLEIYEDGYTLHDKVLRPAKVKVGDGS